MTENDEMTNKDFRWILSSTTAGPADSKACQKKKKENVFLA